MFYEAFFLPYLFWLEIDADEGANQFVEIEEVWRAVPAHFVLIVGLKDAPTPFYQRFDNEKALRRLENDHEEGGQVD